MKPQHIQPPLPTRKNRVKGEGSKGWGGPGRGALGSRHRVSESSANRPSAKPTWMRKLEDRYQKVHKKIAAIPVNQFSTKYFNPLTKKFLDLALAKAGKKLLSNYPHSHYTSNTAPSSHGDSGRYTGTLPNTTSYKDSLRTEELVSQPPNNCSDAESNDSLHPVATQDQETNIDRRSNSSSSASRSSRVPASYLSQRNRRCPCRVQYSNPDTRLPDTHPFLHPLALSGAETCASGPQSLRALPRRTPVVLSERDESVRENRGARPDLAQPAGQERCITSAAWSPQHSSPTRTRTVQCCTGAALRHGHGVSMVTEEDQARLTAGLEPRGGAGGGGGGGGKRGRSGNGVEMGDNFAPAPGAYNPVGKGAKQGSAVLTGLNHHHHHPGYISTRSMPASGNSNELPALSKCKSGGGEGSEGASTEKSDRHKLLPQMSVEARHAISETLREMGTTDGFDERDCDDAEDEDVVQDDDDNTNSITSLPSIADPLPSLPLQRRSWHPNDTPATTQQSRENSLTASQKTTARQKSFRSNRQADNSSVNTTNKGIKSPRRSNKRPPSLQASGNVRSGPKSEKTQETMLDVPSEDNAELGKMDLDMLSIPSVGNAASNRSSIKMRQEPVHKMHLPAITSRTEPNLKRSPRKDTIRHVNYRIRGVGSYRVVRENTFEITAPDFDVRYRDVISCQKGDRETPPPEIFEKSVGKVREWLNKYYSYSPS